MKGARAAVILFICASVLVLLSSGKGHFAFAGGDNDERAQGEFIPTGMRVTPTAAKGSTFQPLSPDLVGHPDFVVGQAVTTAISPDGNTLLILTSGFNSQNDASGNVDPAQSNEYIFIYDIPGPAPLKLQVLQIRNAFDGLAWNPNGKEFYVSGGPDDAVHIFDKSGSVWAKAASVSLGHTQGLGLGFHTPTAAGLAVTKDGTKLVVANWRNDSISMIDTVNRIKISELDLRPGKNDPAQSGVPGGEYPFWVAIKGNTKAYVSSIRDREIVVLDIGSPAPRILSRIAVKGKPNKMILNREQSVLYAATDVTDTVTVIDTSRDRVVEEIPTTAPKTVFPNKKGFKGSNPNSLALSPDERTLFITNGGTNSVAAIQLAGAHGDSEVVGLIPTGWYPNSVSLNADGSVLYVVNGKGNTGPVPRNCTDQIAVTTGNFGPCGSVNQYVWQRTKAGFSTIPLPTGRELADLTRQVARNNHFKFETDDSEENAVTSFLRTKIKHVIYVVKENRTYDQVLGDLEKGNGDPSIVVFPEPISPNHHQLARQFVTLDNFFDSGEVSGDGWDWTTEARTTDSVEKTVPVIYAGRGTFTYDYEGTNRNINTGYATAAQRQAANPLSPADPDILPGTADVSAPDSLDGEAGAGYLWDSALRAGLSVRNYGFFIDLTRYSLPASNPAAISPNLRQPALSNTPVAFPTKQALQNVTDPFFRGYDNKFPDFWRFKEWEREFDGYVKNGNLPSLELVRIMHDHFGNFGTAVDGVNTFETQMADNDYALGLIVDKVAHSPYKASTLIFVVEDDAQDGPDHMDAHRSIAYVVGPHVKQGEVVSTRYTTVNVLRTIEDILGIEPLGLNDGLQEPMSDVFEIRPDPWTYSAIVPEVLRTTSLPLPPPTAATGSSGGADGTRAAYATPRHDAAYLAERTKGMDFDAEDRLDAARFNLILWQAMKDEGVPYPTVRTGQDLRQNRPRLLERVNRAKPAKSGDGASP